METLKLISEVMDHSDASLQTFSEEKEDGKKNLYIKGVFLQAEQKNRNQRIYPINIMDREVQKFTESYISQNRAMGELNHPASPSVNPKEASHLITELNKQGNDYIGKAKILSTPIGMTVRSLIEDGVKLGVSSRALGSLKEGTGGYRGAKIVQDDFRLITVDIVSDPSAHDAWVNGIFESVDFVVNNGVVEQVDKKKLKKLRDQQYKKIKEARTKIEKDAIAYKLVDFISKLKVS